VLGIDQSLVSIRQKRLRSEEPISPVGKPLKRAKRKDAFEIQHQDAVATIEDFWVQFSFRNFYFQLVHTSQILVLCLAICRCLIPKTAPCTWPRNAAVTKTLTKKL